MNDGNSYGALQKQAWVSLSILWAVLGLALIVADIFYFGATIRLAGLALLTLATVKVFIFDLASLDASYRVLSFIGLGILLLAGAWTHQHYREQWQPLQEEPENPG